jgi:2,3-diketo-5-methylthio-1-phosphopentane phosphatase
MNDPARAIFVTDFDGTLARQDFYQLVIAHLLPGDVPNYWQDYLVGRLTHFEVLRNYFGEIRCDESAALSLLEKMELDPELPKLLEELHRQGWEVVIASAGCGWYIDKLLSSLPSRPAVHANPGRFIVGRGLVMDYPHGSRYFSPACGIDKSAIVKAAQVQVGSDRVAYAGDGLTDIIPALLVPEHQRFARNELARVLIAKKQKYHPFNRWSEAARQLLRQGITS